MQRNLHSTDRSNKPIVTGKIQTTDHQSLTIGPAGVTTAEDIEPIDPQQLKLCQQWLSRAEPTPTPTLSSFWLKHVVENWAGAPISNGAIIVAAYQAGFPIAREANAKTGNVNIGLTSSDVEEFDCGCGHP